MSRASNLVAVFIVGGIAAIIATELIQPKILKPIEKKIAEQLP